MTVPSGTFEFEPDTRYAILAGPPVDHELRVGETVQLTVQRPGHNAAPVGVMVQLTATKHIGTNLSCQFHGYVQASRQTVRGEYCPAANSDRGTIRLSAR